ncbi:MFS transporter [Nocardia sp. NPDC052566]|uniref:MFS transporter n=1 Tax=Nocardia sp. NPDC052566 TaxID=3364330 RepID=UPI0037CC1882
MTTTVGHEAPATVHRTAATVDRYNRRWWALAVLALAQLMVVLDATVVNIALPDAQRDLGFSDSSRQWVITGYSLAFGSLLLLGGRFGDMFSRRVIFITGLVGFAAASVVGGMSQNFGTMVSARVVQGVFGALLSPAALSLLSVIFTDKAERAKAFGVYGAVAGAGSAFGLLLGGTLTEFASWRWVFYVNLIFAAVAVIGAALALGRAMPQRSQPLDLPGAVTVTAALFGIVYGFSRAESHGWSDPVTIGFLIASVVLLAAFVLVERTVSHPLLPLRILHDRTRAGAYLSMFVTGVGGFALFLFLTYYLQLVCGYSPLLTGVAFLPMVAAMTSTATLTPTLVLPRIGLKATMGGGFLSAAVGMMLLTGIGTHTSYTGHVLPGLLLLGIGMGVAFSVAIQNATSGVDAADSGVASAMVNTMQQVGGSIGTVLLNAVAATAATRSLSSATAKVQSRIDSYTATFWWSAGIFLIGGLIVVVLLPNKASPQGSADSDPGGGR